MNPSEFLIRENDFKIMQERVKEEAEKRNETGFSLIGKILCNKIFVLSRYVPAGPNSFNDSVTFTTDEKVIQSALEEEQKKDEDERYLGDFHSHTFNGKPSPSLTDIDQLKVAREKRSWFIIGVFNPVGKLRIFGLNDDDNLVTIPYRLVPDNFEEENLLARISKITDNDVLKKARVTIIGLGSLGSGAVSGLAGTGIHDYIIADMENLSLVNVIRHLGNVRNIGKKKTDIIRDYIHSKQPFTRVQTVDDDLIKNRELLRAIIESSDIVVASSGNPELNYQINTVCVELKKSFVMAGIYDKAESAYVLYYDGNRDGCCFDCIFDLTTSAVDQNTINKKYGLEDGELKGAQGHWIDISIPGLIMSKIALNILLKKEMKYNFIRYYDNLVVQRTFFLKKKLCATCDYENWLKNEEEIQDIENEKFVMKKFWKIFLRKLMEKVKIVF